MANPKDLVARWSAWCCSWFEEAVANVGRRYIQVFTAEVVAFGPPRFILQARAVDAAVAPSDVQAPMDVAVTIVDESVIVYCPGCGAKLDDFYVGQIEALRRDELKLNPTRPIEVRGLSEEAWSAIDQLLFAGHRLAAIANSRLLPVCGSRLPPSKPGSGGTNSSPHERERSLLRSTVTGTISIPSLEFGSGSRSVHPGGPQVGSDR